MGFYTLLLVKTIGILFLSFIAILSIYLVVYKEKIQSKNTSDALPAIESENFYFVINYGMVLFWIVAFIVFILLILSYRFPWFYDFRWFHTAAKLVVEKVNPYQKEAFLNALPIGGNIKAPFVYPVNIIPLIIPLGYLSFESASMIWLIINSCGIFFLLLGCLKLLEANTKLVKLTFIEGGLIIYGTVFSVINGNLSSSLAALIVWVFIFAKRKKNIWAGILLGITMIKPTLSLLFWLYFLLKRRFTLIFWGFVTCLILVILGLWFTQTSPWEMLHDYRHNYNIMMQNYFNSPLSAPRRIDVNVIGYRLFPSNIYLASLISDLLLFLVLSSLILYLYNQQKFSENPQEIHVTDLAFLGCLSNLLFYAQPTNSGFLIFSWVFVLRYLRNYLDRKSLRLNQEVFLGAIGVICLMFYSYFSYELIDPRSHPSQGLALNLKAIIGSTVNLIPNYSLLILSLCILTLSQFGKKSQV